MSEALQYAALRNQYNTGLAAFFSALVSALGVQPGTSILDFDVLPFEEAEEVLQIWKDNPAGTWQEDIDQEEAFDQFINSALIKSPEEYCYLEFYQDPKYVIKTSKAFLIKHIHRLLEFDGDAVCAFVGRNRFCLDQEEQGRTIVYSIKEMHLN